MAQAAIKQDKFLDYLWGIETGFEWRIYVGLGWFLDYLWGIETMVKRVKIEAVLGF